MWWVFTLNHSHRKDDNWLVFILKWAGLPQTINSNWTGWPIESDQNGFIVVNDPPRYENGTHIGIECSDEVMYLPKLVRKSKWQSASEALLPHDYVKLWFWHVWVKTVVLLMIVGIIDTLGVVSIETGCCFHNGRHTYKRRSSTQTSSDSPIAAISSFVLVRMVAAKNVSRRKWRKTSEETILQGVN